MTDTEARTTTSPTTRVPRQRSTLGMPTPSPEHWLGEVLAAMGCRRAGRKWQCPAHGHIGLHSAALVIGRRDDDQGSNA